MNWKHDSLPDSDTTVLIRVQDEEYPVAIGFHDGEAWRYADAMLVELPVLGWMELHHAANLIDHAGTVVTAVRDLQTLLPLEPYQLDAYVGATFLPYVKESLKKLNA